MSNETPDLQARQALLLALNDAFTTIPDVAQLAEHAFGMHIDQITSVGRDTGSLIIGLVRRCESHGISIMQTFLQEALYLRPDHSELCKAAAFYGVRTEAPATQHRRRSAASVKSADIDLAVQRLWSRDLRVDDFDAHVWQAILSSLGLGAAYDIETTSAHMDKRRFRGLVREMMERKSLETLEIAIKRAAIPVLKKENEKKDALANFKEAYDRSNWDKVIELGECLEKLRAHTRYTRDKIAKAYRERGIWHKRRKNVDLAIQSFSRAIYFRAEPSQADCYF
jgi:hypothetical protein